MEKYGVFISHRHEDWALAGRIYDFLESRGFQPFLDADSLRQGDFHHNLEIHITQTPYFLCLLTKHTFRDMNPEDWIFRELRIAINTNREILLLSEKGFQFPSNMPDEIEAIRRHHCYEIDSSNFADKMRLICNEDLKKERFIEILDWRKKLQARGNIYLCARKQFEQEFGSLDNRFGYDFVQCVRNGEKYSGKNRIKSIHMSCYAANIIFTHVVDMVDEQAFDRGLMYNIFAQLLEDEDFTLEIIITAPGSIAAQDAIANDKLGNSSLEAYPEAVFLSSYFNIHRLIREDPVFRKAYQNKRFRFMVTESTLPYALFHVIYKDEYKEYNHIKVDLYSEGLMSHMERRCMIIFKEDDQENYNFFAGRYEYIRNVKESMRLVKAYHEKWSDEWNRLKDELITE